MKLGIVICTHNRPEYLKQCIESIKRAEIPEGTEIIIQDDNSDLATRVVIAQTKLPAFYRIDKKGISNSLLLGCDHLFETCDMVMNLDSDALVRNDFIQKILEIKNKFPKSIVTGFNTSTKNKDGSVRHKVISSHKGYNLKPSVGGINMCFDKEQYEKHVRPALIKCLKAGNWDNQACISSFKGGNPCVVVEPSVIQHIGISSAMNHEHPDVADDFKYLSLPNVTLINTACVNYQDMFRAAEACMKGIAFGDFKLLTHLDIKGKHIVKIPEIKSIVEYSEFMFNGLHKYVDTDFALTFHADGFVLDPSAWRKEWFNYDYIGAVWEWYKDPYRVGNGGFALRSRKLLKATSELKLRNDHHIKNFAEDHNLARIYRPWLEKYHGIKFAPEHEARKFSIEGWNTKHNKYDGQFGFHSYHVNFNHLSGYKPYTYPNPKRKINYPV